MSTIQYNNIFAFDFSMNKPALAALINNKLDFYFWPSAIDRKSYERLDLCNIKIFDRKLSSMSDLDETELILTHVERAKHLAEIIADTLCQIADDNNIDRSEIIISNEGFAFSAKGDAALDLSGYKYILMSKLIDCGFKKFLTYSPITLKATAGCSKKNKAGLGKTPMIDAISTQNENAHQFIYVIKNNPDMLKKKTSYCLGVDDIADAYWCLKTTVKKLNIDCIVNG